MLNAESIRLAIDNGLITEKNGHLINWAIQQEPNKSESAEYVDRTILCPKIIVALSEYLINGKLSNERFAEWVEMVGDNTYGEGVHDLFSVYSDYTSEVNGEHYDGPILYRRSDIPFDGSCYYHLPNGKVLNWEDSDGTKLNLMPMSSNFEGNTSVNKGCLPIVLLVTGISMFCFAVVGGLLC